MTRTCAVIQGNLRTTHIREIVDCLNGLFDLVVVSCWEDDRERAAGLPCDVLFNPRPAEPGLANRNLQRISVNAGLEWARDRGCTHVLKWRSDMLPTNMSVEKLLKFCHEKPVSAARARIVTSCFRTLTMEPDWYSSIPDLFAFGTLEDMSRLWAMGEDIQLAPINVPRAMLDELGDDWFTGKSTDFLNLIYCPESELYAIYRSRLEKESGEVWQHSKIVRESLRLIDHMDLKICWFAQTGFRSIVQAWQYPWWTMRQWRGARYWPMPAGYETRYAWQNRRQQKSARRIEREIELQNRWYRSFFGPAVVAVLQGGLGNQLFQYAAARMAAENVKAPLLVDLSRLQVTNNETPRDFALPRTGLAPALYDRCLQADRTYQEKTAGFEPVRAKSGQVTKLVGYFQSERQFQSLGPRLREELWTLKTRSPSFEALQKTIQSTIGSVSVHIRRSDYLKDESTYRYHGICGRPYYDACLKRLRSEVLRPVFFVFCEDSADAREIFEGENIHLVARSPERSDFEDLLLMASCEHHVLANSSFSWWGAFLDRVRTGQVYYPARWYVSLQPLENTLPMPGWTAVPNYSYAVSVVIPTFNRREDLRRAIQSVYDQTFRDWEILVCDDGSTDGSQEMVAESFKSPRVRWIPCGRNGRPAIPRNLGIDLAQGKYVAFLDDDDAWVPRKLERQLSVLEASRSIGVCSNARVDRGSGTPDSYFHERPPDTIQARDLERVNLVICSSALVLRDLAKKVGGFPSGPEFKAVEDYGLWLKLSTLGDFQYIDEELVDYTFASPDSIRNKQVANNLEQLRSSFVHWKNGARRRREF